MGSPLPHAGRTNRVVLLGTAAMAAVVLAAACQPPPPPLPPPGASPGTEVAPVAPIDCAAASAAAGAESFEAPALDGEDLGEAALSAAQDAAGSSGLVEITTIADGRPDFDVVPVGDLAAAVAEEPDAILALDAATTVEATGIATDDPLHADQWSDQVTPYSPVWQCGQAAGITIAVIDTGVDGSHPDLAGRVSPGGSSLGGAATVSAGSGWSDPNGHGTHVAGIAAAAADNGLGIAGVAPRATVLPVRVLGSTGSGWSTDVAAGIVWSVDSGADVINLSLGSSSESTSMSSAIAYAHAAGVVVVAAAGNGGPSGSTHYPAAGPHTVAVASISSSGAVSGFSTNGSYVDLAAPGSSIISTLPGGTYGYKSGTSMATPFVSGLAALMVAANPSMTPDQVTARLISTTSEAGPAGFDNAYGHGVIDPLRAVTGH